MLSNVACFRVRTPRTRLKLDSSQDGAVLHFIQFAIAYSQLDSSHDRAACLQLELPRQFDQFFANFWTGEKAKE